jgi:hypothetical protein
VELGSSNSDRCYSRKDCLELHLGRHDTQDIDFVFDIFSGFESLLIRNSD